MAEPMYWRIAQDLRHEIEDGKLRPGQQLPTEGELRERYRASRNTVREAIRWLANLAMVDSRPGQGTFVAQHPDTFVTTLSADVQTGRGGGEGAAADVEIRKNGHSARWASPRVELRQAADHIARRLEVPVGTLIVTRRQSRYIDDAPWSLQTTFYPMDLVTRGAQGLLVAADIAKGTIAYLHETLGLTQVGYRDTILVRPPRQDEAAFLGLPDDGRIPVAVIIRTGYAESPDGPAPFRVTVSVFPADRNQFVMNSGMVPGDHAEPGRYQTCRPLSPYCRISLIRAMFRPT